MVDTVNNTVQHIDIDGPTDTTWQATSVTVYPNGDRVYVAGNNFSPTSPQGKIFVVDTATNTVVDTVDIGQGASGVAFSPDGSRALVTDTANSVVVIDTGDIDDNNVVGTITNTGPMGYITYARDG